MYFIYMLRCVDNSIYSGITTDLERRFRQHAGEIKGGAKYTASRAPIKYEAVWTAGNRAAASRLEYQLKKLSRSDKERLIQGCSAVNFEVGECSRAEIKELLFDNTPWHS